MSTTPLASQPPGGIRESERRPRSTSSHFTDRFFCARRKFSGCDKQERQIGHNLLPCNVILTVGQEYLNGNNPRETPAETWSSF